MLSFGQKTREVVVWVCPVCDNMLVPPRSKRAQPDFCVGAPGAKRHDLTQCEPFDAVLTERES